MVVSGLLRLTPAPVVGGRALRRRAIVAALVSCGLMTALVVAPELRSQPAVRAQSAVATVAPDERSALAAARAEGRPVEALSDRTELSQTFANPSGTLTLDESLAPVRVHRADGSWAPVDTTLEPQPDGTVAPAATVVGLSFSGGGTGPLAQIWKEGRGLALGWPAPLPAPVLRGDTATYPGVLPGVDLQLTAHPLGFSDLLVVRTPEAARSPALATVRFTVSASGVSLRTGPAGGLSATGASGVEVFAAPAPAMWDESGARSSVAMTVAGGELDLAPDLGMLASAATRFPVSIDPYVAWTGVQEAWTKVDACFPDQTYWNGANDSDPGSYGAVKVGRAPIESGDPCSGTLWRSYFRMDTSRVEGKLIGTAYFNVYETWSSSCASKPADLYTTGAISSSTDWNSRPGSTFWLEKSFAHGHSSSCVRDWESYAVKGPVTDAANGHASTITLMLRAPDEGICYADSTQDTCEWKRFDSGAITASHAPYLSIEYDTPPNAPTGMYTDGSAYLYQNGRVPCDSGTYTINDTTPTLHADVSDPDDTGSSQPQALSGEYAWTWPTGSGSAATSPSTPGSGQTSLATQVTVPGGELADGDSLTWHVRTSDGITASAYSPAGAYCNLVIDAAPVTLSPSVTSADGLYPPGGAGTQLGTPGQFTFGPNGATDVAGYVYGLNTSTPWHFVAASATGLTATVTVYPPLVGPNSLVVRIIGRGGSLGPVVTYDVVTAHATSPVRVAQYHMDVTGGVTVSDADGHEGTAAGTYRWVAGQTGASGDEALHFSSSSPPGYAATQEPVVDTRYGYTVSAWVKPDSTPTTYAEVVSQDGVTGAAFYLQYLPKFDRWSFSVAESDSTSPLIDKAMSDAAPVAGVWTHLVGVYCDDPSCLAPGDTAPGRLFLYVDTGAGLQLQSAQPVFSSPWMSTGGLQFGRGKYNGSETDYLNGAVDDVTIYWADPCQTGTTAPAPTCGIA